MLECRISGTRISVLQSGTGMLRYRTEMLNDGTPMPSCGEYTETCEYEANKIHIRLEGNNKSCEYGAPYQ
jgi:hypothetical protein